MLPIPTTRATAAFLGCLGMWLVALWSHSWAAATLGSALALCLVAVFSATVPLGRRVRAQRLEFAWWLASRDQSVSGAVVPQMPVQVRCYVRHRGAHGIELTRVTPVLTQGARVLDEEPHAISVQPRARNEFTFTLTAQAAGRVVLHGLAVSLRGPLGLFDVPLYFPNALAIKVLPRTVAVRATTLGVLTGLPLDRSGRHRMRRRGGGTELHELREFLPGDPFKSIAWKASAKTGRLLVREVDQEVQQTLVMVLDACGSMRGGTPGERKLDFALELCVAHGRAWLERGDRVGLITVDGRVLANVQPGDGAAHLIRIYDALLASTEVVDADLTVLDDHEVATLVARYVRQQDGVDFVHGRRGNFDTAELAHYLRTLAPAKGASDLPLAPTQAGAVFRRFCRERGIELPHRAEPPGGDKAHCLASSLQLAAGNTRVPRSIVLITDLDGIIDYGPMLAAARLLTRRGHTLHVLVPHAEAIAAAPPDGLAHDLRAIYGRAEKRRLREATEKLGPLGVTLSLVAPDQLAQAASRKLPERARVA
ncbi:MAG TPA: DUF58 domain-containing protein [Polyangiales bacterium]